MNPTRKASYPTPRRSAGRRAGARPQPQRDEKIETDNPLESIGKAVSAPVRGAAGEDELAPARDGTSHGRRKPSQS